ncbi:MAG: hypothetical protein FWG22_03585 [Prolixibacteraceae bacterium]|nr:hypothetical protein [Prolixibacteraceae bacterium]
MKAKSGKLAIIVGVVMLYSTWMMYVITFCYTLGKTHNFIDSAFSSFGIMSPFVAVVAFLSISNGFKTLKDAKAESRKPVWNDFRSVQ